MPVVVADVKGDLSGLAQAGTPGDRITQRAAQTGNSWQPTAYPVEFLALGGLGTGVPVRCTLTDFGPCCCRRSSTSTPPRRARSG